MIKMELPAPAQRAAGCLHILSASGSLWTHGSTCGYVDTFYIYSESIFIYIFYIFLMYIYL